MKAVNFSDASVSGSEAARRELAASGVAAAWRLGQWGLLEGYTSRASDSLVELRSAEKWQLRLGRLLGNVQKK